jgi:hypothetical protein
MNAEKSSWHETKRMRVAHKVVSESACCSAHARRVAAVSPTQLGVPSAWAVSQQTLEVVDHGVAPQG